VTAESEAIGRAILLLEQASVDERPEYWQAVLDDLEPFGEGDTVTNLSVALKYVVALRDRTDRAHTPQGRAVYIEDATLFLRQALGFPH